MRLIFTLILLATISTFSFAQDFSNPVKYIEYFSAEFSHMQELQIEYSSFLVYTGTDIAESKRQDLLTSTQKTHDRFAALAEYPDDKGIKANAVKILETMLEIGNKPYDKQAIEKTGCTDCFASVLAEKELTDKDVDNLGKEMSLMIKSIGAFAKANEVQLTDDESSHETLLGKINRINNYIQELNLATLEVQYADSDIVDALNVPDVAKAKENIKNMVKASNNASKRLKKVARIPEDNTAFGQAQKLVDFYKDAAKKLYPDMVSAYDKKGNIINNKVDLYNKSTQKLTNSVNSYTQKYEQAKFNLQQRHIPKPKEKVTRS
jgi:hypothetical protein